MKGFVCVCVCVCVCVHIHVQFLMLLACCALLPASVVGVLREGGVVGAVGRTLAATDSSPEVLANALTLSERLAQSGEVERGEGGGEGGEARDGNRR